MVNLDNVMPVDDNETYTRHVYIITIMWIVTTILIGIGFTLFIP